MVDLDKSISVARKSGKTALGVKTAIASAKLGDAKAIIIAANAHFYFSIVAVGEAREGRKIGCCCKKINIRQPVAGGSFVSACCINFIFKQTGLT